MLPLAPPSERSGDALREDARSPSNTTSEESQVPPQHNKQKHIPSLSPVSLSEGEGQREAHPLIICLAETILRDSADLYEVGRRA